MEVKDIKRVCVVGGGGVIGAYWATFFLWKRFTTVVYDINDDALHLARSRISDSFSYLVNMGVLTDEFVKQAMNLAVYTINAEEAFSNVQFVQESVRESYEVKKAVLSELDKYGFGQAIFASSTSGLLITEIAKGSRFPERCIGAHPYNPPHLIPLVEMTKGEKTSLEYFSTAYNFYKSIGKKPVVLKKESLGFIANRLQMAVLRESIDLVIKGVCSIEDIDKSICFGPGLRWALMGPNLTLETAGGKVGISGLMRHLSPSWEMWLADMAMWNKFPQGSEGMLQQGVDEEKTNRNSEEGKTTAEIIRWRDEKLIEILKLLKLV